MQKRDQTECDNLLLLVPELGNLLLDTLLALGKSKPCGLELERLLLPLLLGLGAGLLVLLEGVLADGSVGLGVEVLEGISLHVIVDVLLELRLVALLIIIGKGLHVLSDVATEDVLAEDLSVELLGLNVEAGESVLRVGNEDATVGSALQDTEDTGTGGGAGKADIEEGLEGTALAIVGLGSLGEGELSIRLLDTGKLLVEAELLEDTAGDQQTSGVGSGPVGQAVLNAVVLELVRVGRDENLVTSELRADDLGDDVAVGEANDKAVLGRIVLVLGLGDEALAGVVVGLALTSALVLGLEATVRREGQFLVGRSASTMRDKGNIARKDSPVVRAVLNQLVVHLIESPESAIIASETSIIRSILH